MVQCVLQFQEDATFLRLFPILKNMLQIEVIASKHVEEIGKSLMMRIMSSFMMERCF